MGLAEEISTAMARILGEPFTSSKRTSDVVPVPAKMTYDKGIKMTATYMYADMQDSTRLVTIAPDNVTAAVLRTYLDATVRVIRAHDGHIRSFDGDRVMGVFGGPDQADRAANAALKLNHVVAKTVRPALTEKFEPIRKAGWLLKCGIGIASGETTMVKVGIRGNDDMVSLGVAPNLAARLSELRTPRKQIFVSSRTYGEMTNAVRQSKGKYLTKNMFTGPVGLAMGGTTYGYYRSGFMRSI